MQFGSNDPHAPIYIEASEILEALSSPEAWIRTIKARELGATLGSVDSVSTCNRAFEDMCRTVCRLVRASPACTLYWADGE